MEDLVNKAKNGDTDALTTLIYDIKLDLYKIARTRLSCQDDIEDAIQETIIEAFNSIHKLRESKYFKTWIIKILINRCNRIYSKNKKENISFENINSSEFIRI
jgi:RNA polymerase sigma-70 factor (ECF subfamily)